VRGVIVLLRLLALRIVPIGLALLMAAACGGGSDDGGDGGESLEAYLQQYEALDNRAEVATDELDADYADVLSQEQLTDDNRPDVQQYFEELGEIGQTYVDDLSDLDPPAEAESLHDDSIESYQQVLDLIEEASAGIGQATSIVELQALFNTPDINAALDDANADCVALQQLAVDNNVAVDFECQNGDEAAGD
jgi:hypothetical protein